MLDTSRTAQCLAATSSYQAFVELSNGDRRDWAEREPLTTPTVAELLDAAGRIGGTRVDVIAVDMPVATTPISGRRAADSAISKEFGGRWCSAHSPSATRPGLVGAKFSRECAELGYPVATADTPVGTLPRLVEVYPHPALLTLLKRERRIPYKVAKGRSYWPNDPPSTRRVYLFAEQRLIELKLAEQLGPLPISGTRHSVPPPTAILKRFEDSLDAIISAWVGSLYAAGQAVPFGDGTAAVWCPLADE